MANDDTRLPSDLIRVALASTIGRWTEGTGDTATPIPNLAFFRREAPTPPASVRSNPASCSSFTLRSGCWWETTRSLTTASVS